MSYNNAIQVLPSDLIAQIQGYIDGEYIYIPKRQENKKSWGEDTNIKKELKLRNLEIYAEYLSGMHINSLAERFYLSPKSIQRIILNEKKKSR